MAFFILKCFFNETLALGVPPWELLYTCRYIIFTLLLVTYLSVLSAHRFWKLSHMCTKYWANRSPPQPFAWSSCFVEKVWANFDSPLSKFCGYLAAILFYFGFRRFVTPTTKVRIVLSFYERFRERCGSETEQEEGKKRWVCSHVDFIVCNLAWLHQSIHYALWMGWDSGRFMTPYGWGLGWTLYFWPDFTISLRHVGYEYHL